MVEDRHNGSVGKTVGGVTITGLILVLAVGYFGSQGQALNLLDEMKNQPIQEQSVDTTEFIGKDAYEVFSSTVLGSNNALWKKYFKKNGIIYIAPKLVLFRGQTQSGCGAATSQIGPHYCPADKTIYLDERFFEELTKKFGAKGGDVEEAYVISHEVAHHIQNELGISMKIENIRKWGSKSDINEASIKLELQADCFAGIWASSISGKGILEKNEISEAIDAAESVGDDRIQKAAYGKVHPETWTHGSSADRKMWFNILYNNASFEMCDTFK